MCNKEGALFREGGKDALKLVTGNRSMKMQNTVNAKKAYLEATANIRA